MSKTHCDTESPLHCTWGVKHTILFCQLITMGCIRARDSQLDEWSQSLTLWRPISLKFRIKPRDPWDVHCVISRGKMRQEYPCQTFMSVNINFKRNREYLLTGTNEDNWPPPPPPPPHLWAEGTSGWILFKNKIKYFYPVHHNSYRSVIVFLNNSTLFMEPF